MTKHPFLRWPLSAFGVFGLGLALVWFWVGQPLPFAATPGDLLQENPLHVSTLERVEAVSPVGDMLVVNVESDELFSEPVLGIVEDLSDNLLKALPVRTIKSLTHAVMPVREGFRLRFEPLMPPAPRSAQELGEFRELTTTHPLMRNVLVSENGQHTLITLELREMPPTGELRETVDEVIANALAGQEGLVRVDYLTLPLALEEMVRLAQHDSLKLSLLGFPLVLLFLVLVFRSVRLIGFLLAGVLLYGLGLALVLPLVVEEFSPYNLAILPILLAIQLALLVHLAWGLKQERRSDPEGQPREIAGRVMQRLWRPCLFAALTSAGALFSFVLAPMEEIRQVGRVGAVGVLLGWLLAFGPGACFLYWAVGRRPASEMGAEGQSLFWAWVVSPKALRWKGKAILGVLLLVSLPGLWGLRPDIHLSRFLDPETDTGRMFSLMEEQYGGYTLFEISVDSGQKGGLHDLDFLLWLEERVDVLAGLEGVSAVYAYPQVLGLLHEIWQGGAEESRKVPQNATVRRVFTTALQTQRQFALFDLLVDEHWQSTRVYLRSRDQTAAEYLGLLDEVAKTMQQDSPAGVSVTMEQGRQKVLEAERRITGALVRSLGASLLGITLILWVLWRSLSMALMAVGTVAAPLLCLFGVMGYAGIPLNVSTVLAATLILGVAIDDVVHLFTSWKRYVREGETPLSALGQAWRRKGPAILTTTGVLVLLYLMLPLSRFPPIRDLGWLLAWGFIIVLALVWLLPRCFRPGLGPR
ncbi:MAG: MMPL family transporter [Opitutales bacterium]|nr:MMPL family transporter [Opitutales bacterium]